MPIENAQELAKEEGEESEAMMTTGGAIPAVAGKRRDTWRRLPRSTNIVWWARFASGQPPQVETNSDAPASFSSSPLAPSALA